MATRRRKRTSSLRFLFKKKIMNIFANKNNLQNGTDGSFIFLNIFSWLTGEMAQRKK